jgi:hypothetical protein
MKRPSRRRQRPWRLLWVLQLLQRAVGPVIEAAARTQGGRFVCPVCGLTFTTKHRMKQLLLRKHAAAAEPIICTCGQPFLVPEDLDAHLKRPLHGKRMVCYHMFSILLCMFIVHS